MNNQDYYNKEYVPQVNKIGKITGYLGVLHKKVRIGVIKGGKVKKYYEVTTGLEKEIPVKDTDTYSVFVQNMTNSTINAKGSYIK